MSIILKAVESVFKDDDKILQYYDPTREFVVTKGQVVEDIILKIFENYNTNEGCTFYVFEDNKGFVFGVKDKLLISFGLNSNCRDILTKERYWQFIINKMGVSFQLLLFTRNTRAINWAIKNGMKTQKQTEILTLLKL